MMVVVVNTMEVVMMMMAVAAVVKMMQNYVKMNETGFYFLVSAICCSHGVWKGGGSCPAFGYVVCFAICGMLCHQGKPVKSFLIFVCS